MFLIRHALPKDLDDLHALARQTYFINLPPDREIIQAKIDQSIRSFRSLAGKPSRSAAPASAKEPRLSSGSGIRSVTGRSDLFLFVLEDLHTGGVIGTSQIIARMGGRGHPRLYLALSTMTRQSTSLKISWTHQMARLERDESGPTELGGLILNHAFRGHPQRLGRFLSFVRFHFIGLYRERFADSVVAEMLGPIDRNGYNPFFEKFTRHFVPRSFPEVYRFSQSSKEFVEGLMPPGLIDLSIMDPEVAASAGSVGPDTEPARKLLERLGFQYRDHIDPLDGGPHLEARTRDIPLVRQTRLIKSIAGGARLPANSGRSAPRAQSRRSNPKSPDLIISTLDDAGNFRAVQSFGTLDPPRAGSAAIVSADAQLLQPGGLKPARAGATLLKL
ncbi:MAG: arginine N-succinyltransferase [Phycisphaeraceae bacterium]|nr:arginine N-succinyltransferase [Phycisphaeraceae bacterium]